MRSFLAAISFAAGLITAQPASAEVAEFYGPGSMGLYPTYSLPIHVIDGIRGTLPQDRRKEWTRERDKALEEWGLPFYVTKRAEALQPFPATDENISTLGTDPLIVPDAIALVRVSALASSAGWSDLSGGGIALLAPWRGWWSGPNSIAPYVAHEVGHALGFNHGGTGVMMGAPRVNDEERQLAASYYLGVAS